ncbi:hypothetical protein [Chitinophaga nivalis]|uniref:Oxidase n=1 Tax=Chitinophaga nivalis TaxID=2991709 RepID=A0ABT3IFX2_9BACT|nr:hypothetical protein [Chitinophaga nivalis]MCW3467644.1 hypothetical protein [Chitinophaga nivalis]MCW3482664.1 hypothetical protein [Chitinophaga nivalis]
MKDILLNKETDLDIAAGDLVTGSSELQQQELLLINNKGTIKEFPATGIDAYGYLQDNNTTELLYEIRRQFLADGMEVVKIDITGNGQLNIDANYGNS